MSKKTKQGRKTKVKSEEIVRPKTPFSKKNGIRATRVKG